MKEMTHTRPYIVVVMATTSGTTTIIARRTDAIQSAAAASGVKPIEALTSFSSTSAPSIFAVY